MDHAHEGHPTTRADATRIARQLAAIEQIAHIGSWQWDVPTNVVTWSDELYRIYGLEPGSVSISLESFLERVHPGDRENTLARVREAMATGTPFEYPERIVRPDGSVRDLETKGDVVRDETGAITALIGTCRDVTDERKRNETIKLYGDIVKNIQIGLSVWTVVDPDAIDNIRLVAFNPAAERLSRMELGAEIGKSLPEILPYAADGQLQTVLLAVARDGGTREAMVERSRDPRVPNRALSMKGFPLPGKCVGVAFEDITESTRARRLRDAELGLFEMIVSGASLNEILKALALAVEAHSPPMIASVVLLDEDGVRVRHGAAPNLPGPYIRDIEGASIGPRAGSCGAAMYMRRPVYVNDIATDPLWDDYRSLALSHDLRACWSTPIVANDGRVLGSFALYYTEPRSPGEDDVALIGRAARIAGIAIERRQLEDQFRALSAHVEAVREDERTGIAREIHDELGQALTALKLELAWLGRRAAEPEGATSQVVLDQVKSMSLMTDGIIAQVRKISADLRPGVLDDFGLLAAIEWQGQEFSRRTGLACDVSSNLGDVRFGRDLTTAVFRIFQETLTNVVRHADARHVEARLECRERCLELEVHDDGKGISLKAAESPKSLGLLGIRERARRLRGTVTILGVAGRGTTLTLRVPLPSSEGGAA